jgi:hypothetical protein
MDAHREGEDLVGLVAPFPQLPRVVLVNSRTYPAGLEEADDPSVHELRWAFRLAYCLAHRSIGSPLFLDTDGIGMDLVVRPVVNRQWETGIRFRAVRASYGRYGAAKVINGFDRRDTPIIQELCAWIDSFPATMSVLCQQVDYAQGDTVNMTPADLGWQRVDRPPGVAVPPARRINRALNTSGMDMAPWRMN